MAPRTTAKTRSAPVTPFSAPTSPEIGLPAKLGMRWNIRYRLHRRVIEIRDARLVLRPYAKTEVAGLAADAAKSSGLAPGQSRCGRGSGAPGRTTKPFLFPEGAPEPHARSGHAPQARYPDPPAQIDLVSKERAGPALSVTPTAGRWRGYRRSFSCQSRSRTCWPASAAIRAAAGLRSGERRMAERLPFTPVPLLAGYATAGTRFRS